jgi:hypothetical protein
MRLRGVALAGTLALALAACGSKNEWAPTTGGGGGEGGGGGGGQGGPCPDGVALKVVGIDPGSVTSVSFVVLGVTAAYEAGGPIALTHVGAVPSVDANPHPLAVLDLPGLKTDWGHALVTLELSSLVARLHDLGGGIDLSCTAPLRLEIDPGLVKPDTCEVFLKLDVARSFAVGPQGLAFLPQYRVVYY